MRLSLKTFFWSPDRRMSLQTQETLEAGHDMFFHRRKGMTTSPLSSEELFKTLYLAGITRSQAQKALKGKPEGTFILRDVSQTPYALPTGMDLAYAVSYWNYSTEKFNHVLICSDSQHINWSVLVDENEYQHYDSLKSILQAIPCLGKTFMKKVYTLPL